jgi:hypothetical protein
MARAAKEVSADNTLASWRSVIPKTFLRLVTKNQASDCPITLAKRFFEFSLVDYKGLEFYHRH